MNTTAGDPSLGQLTSASRSFAVPSEMSRSDSLITRVRIRGTPKASSCRRRRHVANLRPAGGDLWKLLHPSRVARSSSQIQFLKRADHAIQKTRFESPRPGAIDDPLHPAIQMLLIDIPAKINQVLRNIDFY